MENYKNLFDFLANMKIKLFFEILIILFFISGCGQSSKDHEIREIPEVNKVISEHFRPHIVVDGMRNVHVTWESKTSEGEYIYYKKLDSNGKVLIDNTKISNTVLMSGQTSGPETAIDSEGNLHIFKEEEGPAEKGKPNIYVHYLKVKDGNLLFEKNIKKYDETRDQKVAIDKNDNIHLVWSEWKQEGFGYWDVSLYYGKLSTNGDILIGPKELLKLENRRGDLKPKKVIIDKDGNVHIAFDEFWKSKDEGHDSKYIQLDLKGNILREEDSLVKVSKIKSYPILLINGLLSYMSEGGIVDSKGNIHIFYEEADKMIPARRTYTSLVYTKKNNKGKTLINKKNISTFSKKSQARYGPSIGPEIDTAFDDSNNVHVVWYINDGLNNFEIHYSKLDNNGNILIKDIKIA